MKRSFQALYAAVLLHVSLLSGRAPLRRNRFGMMGGGSQQFAMQPASSYAGQGSTQLPGLISNSIANQPNKQTSGIPVSPGALYLHSQRFTSATAMAPPVVGMYLVDVAVEGGATPGGLALLYNTPSISIFACPTSATDATGAIGAERSIHYPVSWLLGGTSIPSSIMVFKGGLGATTVTYSTLAPSGNPDISAYRAIYVTGTESATTGTARTVTFDAQPGIIRAVIVMCNNATTGTATGIPAGNITYPASGQFQQQVCAQGPTSELQLVGVQPFPASQTVSTTHTATTLGGSTTFTIAAVHFY